MTRATSHIFIGIDGGGTGCRVALRRGSNGPVVEGAGGRANIMTDPETAIANVSTAVDEILRATDRSQTELSGARIHLGLAGVVDDRHDAALSAAFPASVVTVSDDRLTTLVGALGRADGSLAGIGTGSFVGRRTGHDVRFVGGWGGIVGDQSSGAWLGKRVLEETLKANDGLIMATPLATALLQEFGGPVGVVSFARTARPGDFAALAPNLIKRSDDPLAQVLMREGVDYILAALGALDARPGERLVLTGGLGRFYQPLLPTKWQDGIADPIGTALNGALQLAQTPL